MLSNLLYSGMSGVRDTVRTSGLFTGEGDRPNVPIGESYNTWVMQKAEAKVGEKNMLV